MTGLLRFLWVSGWGPGHGPGPQRNLARLERVPSSALLSAVDYRETMTKARTAALLATIALGASLSACFPAQLSRPVEPIATESEAERLPDNCLEITDGAIAKLGGKISEYSPNAEILRTGLVLSETGEMWYLAVQFHDEGLDQDFTGVWGSLQDLTADEDPAFLAVDEVAEASAEYLQPVEFDGTGVLLPGAEAATACLS